MNEKFKHTLESCWLCMKYPFLYPRNRFTGRHRTGALSKRVSKLSERSILHISITGEVAKDKKTGYSTYADFTNVRVRLNKENNTITFSNPIQTKVYEVKGILGMDDRFEILGLNLVFSMCGTPIVKVMVKVKDENDKANYGFRYDYVELVTNKWFNFWRKVTSWFDEQVLDRILFIPTFTEWDAMPTGWRKAFGDQYLKDLKKQLKKDHMLYSWRITQIKEKFGTLRLYCSHGTRELYDLINTYEDLSWHTCIRCGKPAKYNTTGWIEPYCEDCLNEMNVPVDDCEEIK